MYHTNKKKYVLSLAIILALLIVIAMPLIFQNAPTTFPQPNALANIQTPNTINSKANPQPQPNLWWNHSWNYRMEVNVTEPGYADRINEIAKIHLNFIDLHCANNSIRVLYYNASTTQWVEVPIQIGNLTYYGGTRVQSCDLLFLCNVTNGGTSTYYVYYNGTYTGAPPTYTTPLNITINPGGTTYFTFETGVISGNYTIRYSHTVVPNNPPYMYDDDACFRIFKVNGTNIIPTNGLHSGLDRIDADDLLRWNSSSDQPLTINLTWTAQLLESGPLRAIVRVYKMSFDRFTQTSLVNDGNYSGMNKTYTFYAYQGYISVNIVNTTGNYSTVPIYDFAVVAVTNQWNLYIDTYNLGTATGWPWTDKISSPQPFNHMSLVRNDGLGLALLGSPLWPDDEFGNRTSLEFGYGGIDANMQSFLFRNDGRRGDMPNVEYRIRIPFTYYIAGITQGFDQVINTWYQVNNPTQATNGTETNKFYPLVANVTDWFYNPIPGANVTVYNDSGLTQLYTNGTTNSQGLCTFLLNLNNTPSQYWIQAYQYNSYKNYVSNASYWNPVLNFTYPSSTLNIRMNITTVYVEAWDFANHRLQNATVTLNYTDVSYTPISQIVDEFYANCSFYAWSDQNLSIDIYVLPTKESSVKIYNLFANGTKGVEVTPPINTNESKRFRVETQRDIGASPTQLSSNVTTISKYWKDNVTFYVWLNSGEPPTIPINADWINFTIYNSTGGIAVPAINMTLVLEGQYSYTFNTSTVGGLGLLGGETYTITVTAITNSPYLNPTPTSIFLQVQNLPVEVFSAYSLENPIVATWFEPLHLAMPAITVRLTDIHNGLRINNANVTYTITGTTHVNEIMNFTGAGIYQVNETVVDSLITGNFTISIVSSLQNYTIPDKYIKLTINLAPTLILAPSTKVQGYFNQNISVYVEFVRGDDLTPIIGASVSWIIQGTNITGTLTDPSNIGNYSGQILNGTLTSGSYVLIVQGSKENYATKFESLSLEVLGAQTLSASALLFPQLFGSSEFLFAGSLIQVENSWIVAPISFTFTDINGNPVPNASITVSGGLPVFDVGSGTIKGLGGSQVGALQLGAGTYLVLVPTFGLPPSALPITILCQATNYQPQQISFVVSIKERAIALGPTRVPVSTFFITLAAIAIPTALFLSYTFLQRARIPAIIKRIDELIRAISRGEKVTVKLIPREKFIADILREELAIVGVEPRVEKYIPVEIADLIVPLLVESGMKEKEAYAMALELKTAAPAEREKLLESVGIPGESSARIIQTIEEYEEKQEPLRKPKGRKPTEEEKPTEEGPKEEAKEEGPKEEAKEEGPKEDQESEDSE